jgi:hypothetical protein
MLARENLPHVGVPGWQRRDDFGVSVAERGQLVFERVGHGDWHVGAREGGEKVAGQPQALVTHGAFLERARGGGDETVP